MARYAITGASKIAPQPEEVDASMYQTGQQAASIAESGKDVLDTLDKMHETRLENTGLLDDVKWQSSILDPTGATKDLVKIDMFERVDTGEVSLNPIDYYGRTTTPTFERIKVNQAALDKEGWGGISNKLLDEGYTQQNLVDIARNTEGIQILPHDYIGPVQPNQIIDTKPSGVSLALDKLEAIGKKGFTGVTDIGKELGSAALGEGKEFIGDIGEVASELGGEVYDIGKEVLGKGLDIGKKIGGKGLNVSGNILKSGYKGVAEVTKQVIGAADPLLDPILGIAEKGAGLIGKQGGKVLGKVAGKAAPVISGVTGALDAIKSFEAGKIGQGVEDTIQAGIGVASPFLLASGPAGWAVLAASFLEDMFFD